MGKLRLGHGAERLGRFATLAAFNLKPAELAHDLKRVEAGAQGGHKLARGYRPQLVYSAHDVVHEGLQGAVDRYLRSERRAVETERQALDADSPYRKDG